MSNKRVTLLVDAEKWGLFKMLSMGNGSDATKLLNAFIDNVVTKYGHALDGIKFKGDIFQLGELSTKKKKSVKGKNVETTQDCTNTQDGNNTIKQLKQSGALTTGNKVQPKSDNQNPAPFSLSKAMKNLHPEDY